MLLTTIGSNSFRFRLVIFGGSSLPSGGERWGWGEGGNAKNKSKTYPRKVNSYKRVCRTKVRADKKPGGPGLFGGAHIRGKGRR